MTAGVWAAGAAEKVLDIRCGACAWEPRVQSQTHRRACTAARGTARPAARQPCLHLVLRLLNDCPSVGRLMVPHCGFSLHFSSYSWAMAPSYVVSHLGVFCEGPG